MSNRFVKAYASFVVDHPFMVVLLALIITLVGGSFYGQLENNNPSVDEILPADMPVVAGITKLSDDLGGGESTAFMVVVELDPQIGSQINDIRDPEVVRYTNLLSKQIEKVEDVTGTSGLGNNIYSLNSNSYANSLKDVKQIVNDNPNTFGRIVNDKYSLTIIRVYANEGFDVGFLVNEVTKVLENTPKPTGVKTVLAGEEIANKISEDLTGPDSQKTTNISLLAIVVILLITFQSIIYGALPLLTIIFGVLWTLAFMAVVGIAMSSFTAGAISMIVGIGIDFGIQTIMRYRQELEQSNPVLALEQTLENVLTPMFVTTIAAFIGFWSMTFGDFSILGELGKIMALGVIFCFLAAATVVPAISVLYEKYKPKKKLNSPIKVIKKLFTFLRHGGKVIK